MLKDELDLDGRPNLNLASFVGTYMEREAEAVSYYLQAESPSRGSSHFPHKPPSFLSGIADKGSPAAHDREP